VPNLLNDAPVQPEDPVLSVTMKLSQWRLIFKAVGGKSYSILEDIDYLRLLAVHNDLLNQLTQGVGALDPDGGPDG